MARERGSRARIEALYPGRGRLYTRVITGPLSEHRAEFASAVEGRLLAGETRLDQGILDELQRRSDLAAGSPSPFVQQARGELRDFFLRTPAGQSSLRSLREKGYGLMMYGSLQYGDPRNCDVDLFGVARDIPMDPSVEAIEDAVGEAIVPYWGRFSTEQGTPRGEASFFTASLTDFRKDPPHRLLQDYVDDRRNTDPFDLAPMVTGVALFPEDEELVSHVREEARRIAESDPLICAMINVTLARCLENRRERER